MAEYGKSKKRIIGGKRATIEATAIMNPNTNKFLVSKEQIKAVSLKYCKDTLADNEPSEGYEAKRDSLEKKLLECNGTSN